MAQPVIIPGSKDDGYPYCLNVARCCRKVMTTQRPASKHRGGLRIQSYSWSRHTIRALNAAQLDDRVLSLINEQQRGYLGLGCPPFLASPAYN